MRGVFESEREGAWRGTRDEDLGWRGEEDGVEWVAIIEVWLVC